MNTACPQLPRPGERVAIRVRPFLPTEAATVISLRRGAIIVAPDRVPATRVVAFDWALLAMGDRHDA